MKNLLFVFSVFLLFSCTSKPSLEEKLNAVIQGKKAKIGIAVLDLKDGNLTEINGNDSFPLQSVFKFHVAAKVLDLVDKDSLKLDGSLAIKSSEILVNTYSPLRDERGVKDMNMRLDSLIYYMVSTSDNNACDILLRRAGGPAAVNTFFKDLGISGTQIEVNEEEMHQDWEIQFRNIATPVSVVKTLHKFYLREYLTGNSHDFLYAMMTNSTTGKNRIKAGVPKGTYIAHKTGTSGRNANGVSSATNDAAIITLTNGQTYILAVFVTDSKESDEVNEKIIADITRAVTN
jgi:beta-lactamase class A